jgi:hypothetical protein
MDEWIGAKSGFRSCLSENPPNPKSSFQQTKDLFVFFVRLYLDDTFE